MLDFFFSLESVFPSSKPVTLREKKCMEEKAQENSVTYKVKNIYMLSIYIFSDSNHSLKKIRKENESSCIRKIT